MWLSIVVIVLVGTFISGSDPKNKFGLSTGGASLTLLLVIGIFVYSLMS